MLSVVLLLVAVIVTGCTGCALVVTPAHSGYKVPGIIVSLLLQARDCIFCLLHVRLTGCASASNLVLRVHHVVLPCPCCIQRSHVLAFCDFSLLVPLLWLIVEYLYMNMVLLFQCVALPVASGYLVLGTGFCLLAAVEAPTSNTW